MLINPAVLFEAIRTVPEVDEFQVVLDRVNPADPFSMDEMILRVASSTTDRAGLTEVLIRAAQGAVQVRPRVVFEAPRAIYDHDTQVKAVRLVDRR
jgi:phenylacetate-CoA ligase